MISCASQKCAIVLVPCACDIVTPLGAQSVRCISRAKRACCVENILVWCATRDAHTAMYIWHVSLTTFEIRSRQRVVRAVLYVVTHTPRNGGKSKSGMSPYVWITSVCNVFLFSNLFFKNYIHSIYFCNDKIILYAIGIFSLTVRLTILYGRTLYRSRSHTWIFVHFSWPNLECLKTLPHMMKSLPSRSRRHACSNATKNTFPILFVAFFQVRAKNSAEA